MKKVVMVAVAAALLGGCAVKDQVSYSLQSLQTVPLSAFQPSESNPNQRVYKEPGVDLRQYNEVLLDPLQFIRQENGQWYLLTTSEQSLIGRYYHDKFQSELISHGVKIATVPGPGVMRIQIAINVTREVIGKEPYLLKVGSMAQLLDSRSGKLLVRVMDVRESPDTTHKDSPITAGEMEKMIDQWAASRAKQLADNLGR